MKTKKDHQEMSCRSLIEVDSRKTEKDSDINQFWDK
jgi:hypothetical protein